MSHSRAFGTAIVLPTPWNSRPAVTLSSVLRHGISASDWNMYPARVLMPASGAPCTSVRPDDGASRPAGTFSSLDLPQPVGPTTDTNCPLPTELAGSRTAQK